MKILVAEKLERIIGPLPGQREAWAASFLTIAVSLVVCTLSLYYGFHGKSLLAKSLGNDFVAFYTSGRILDQHEPARLYEPEYLWRLEHETVPETPPNEICPFAYPPVVAQLFRPLASVPYRWAYCIWLAFSMAVYALGLWLLFRDRHCASYRRTAVLLSLSAPMYIMETWIGGQLSFVTFFAVALFVYCFENGWPALAGLALGVVAYKPSLIAIPVAVMIVGGCWRMLAGLGGSTTLMALASVASTGADGFERWIRYLRVYGSVVTSDHSPFPLNKYVDLNTFFAALLGRNSFARVFAAVSIGACFAILAWSWWQSRRQRSHEVQRYLWAATLAWTLIINVYVGIYDAVLLVPAAALVARSSANRGKPEQVELQAWLTLLWVASWFTQAMALGLRLQILTVVIAGFGYWALSLARLRSDAIEHAPERASTPSQR